MIAGMKLQTVSKAESILVESSHSHYDEEMKTTPPEEAFSASYVVKSQLILDRLGP